MVAAPSSRTAWIARFSSRTRQSFFSTFPMIAILIYFPVVLNSILESRLRL